MPCLLNMFYFAVTVLLCPVWLWRMIRGRFDVGGIGQRLVGRAPAPTSDRPLIWLHGASVGELSSLQPVISRLQQHSSELQLAVSTYTTDGFSVASQMWPQSPVFWLPFDFSWSVRRAINTLKPQLLVLSELELWPNLLLAAAHRQIPVAVVSSRLNDDDITFYRRMNFLLEPALKAVCWWGAQTQRDADRIASLRGTSQTTIEVTGSVKFDVASSAQTQREAAELRHQLGFSDSEQLLVAGSTHAPEEQLLVNAFRILQKDHPDLRLILVPRHPRRAGRVMKLVDGRHLSCHTLSQLAAPAPKSAAVTIIDTIGRLPAIWELADVGFVGATLAPGRGGQNMIEPAMLGIPICFGPQVWNFQQAAEGLLDVGGAYLVRNEQEIVQMIAAWLQNPASAQNTASKARAFVRSQGGAAEITVQSLLRLMSPE